MPWSVELLWCSLIKVEMEIFMYLPFLFSKTFVFIYLSLIIFFRLLLMN